MRRCKNWKQGNVNLSELRPGMREEERREENSSNKNHVFHPN